MSEAPPFLPYTRHSITEEDVEAVTRALRSGWLTTGPAVERFERALAERAGSAHAVVVSSGTAALHAVTHALGLGPGDEVIVPSMTFAATANAVLFEGARPVFADIDPRTLNLTAGHVEDRLSERTRAVIAVDYAGLPCDYDALREVCTREGLTLVADASHALGATLRGRPVGSLADLTTFSFHPAKHVAAGEGGAVTTDDAALAARMRRFRFHGLSREPAGGELGAYQYVMVELGYNYRLSDLHAALGHSQLCRLDAQLARRRDLAARYDRAFAAMPRVERPARADDGTHALHLYVIQVAAERRDALLAGLRAEGIGANVHYLPVHLHPFYREHLGTGPGHCPHAEAAYERVVSLPLFADMTEADVDRVVAAVGRLIG